MSRKRNKVSREQWLQAAIAALGEGGLRAVAVEPLARRLDVTKGSFYWHFSNRDELVAEIVERWELGATVDVIAALERLQDPRAKLRGLLEAAWKQLGYMRAEAALRAAAQAEHPVIAPVYARVHRRRLEYTVQLYLELGLEPEEANHWGMTAYGSFLGTVGMLEALPEHFNEDDLRRYLDHLHRVLVPSPG